MGRAKVAEELSGKLPWGMRSWRGDGRPADWITRIAYNIPIKSWRRLTEEQREAHRQGWTYVGERQGK